MQDLSILRLSSIFYGGVYTEWPGRLEDLFLSEYFSEWTLTSGRKHGYYFGVLATRSYECFLGAVPVEYGKTGRKAFICVDRNIYALDVASSKTNSNTIWIPGEDGVPASFWAPYLNRLGGPYAQHAIPSDWVLVSRFKNEEKKSLKELVGDASSNVAAEMLVKRGDSAIEKLLELVEDRDGDKSDCANWSYRKSAARILGCMKLGEREKNVAHRLKEAVKKEKSFAVRAWILYALGEITGNYDKYASKILSVKRPYPNYEARAVGAFGKHASAQAPRLTRLLKKVLDLKLSRPQSRGYCVSSIIEALGGIGAASAASVPMLLDLLEKEPYHSHDILYALANIHSHPNLVVPRMIDILRKRNQDWHIVWEAAIVLEKYGPKAATALPVLKECRAQPRLALPATLAMKSIVGELEANPSQPTISRNDLAADLNEKNNSLDIASKHIESGKYEKAITIADSMTNEYERMRVLFDVAERYSDEREYEKAMNVALKIDDTYIITQTFLLSIIAGKSGGHKNKRERTRNIYKAAFASAMKIDNPTGLAMALIRISEQSIASNLKDISIISVVKAQDAIKKMDNPLYAALAYDKLAKRFIELKRKRKAETLLRLATAVTRTLKRPYYKAYVLRETAKVYDELGMEDGRARISSEAVEILMDGLENTSPEFDRITWGKLVDMLTGFEGSAKRAVPLLIAGLADDNVETSALYALESIAPYAIPELLEALNDKTLSLKVRESIGVILLANGETAAIPEVIRLFEIEEKVNYPVKEITKIGEAALPCLASHIGTSEDEVNSSIHSTSFSQEVWYSNPMMCVFSQIFEDFPSPSYLGFEERRKLKYTSTANSYIACLRRLMKSTSKEQRLGAAICLAWLGDKEAGEYVLSLVKKSKPEKLRQDMISVLGYPGMDDAIPELIKISEIGNQKAAMAAIYALGFTKGEKAVEQLLKILDTTGVKTGKKWEARQKLALCVLGRRGGSKTVSLLKELLKRMNGKCRIGEVYREKVVEILNKITGKRLKQSDSR
ncbi:MAG: HEAT repeat domain-containing protein [Kiritimatiellaeota bacterium]|nr:HEAT repeat domain-containing protein [Kiritimatiellota bacterium]